MSEAHSTQVQPDLTQEPAPVADAPVVDPGQGEGHTDSGLYSLESIPEEIREQVAPIFKEWDGNVTREFQKRAEQWKPYEELGIRDLDPEDLGALMGFYEAAQDETTFKDWVTEAARELGLSLAPAEGDVPGDEPDEPDEGDVGELTPERIEQMIAQSHAERDAAEAARKEEERVAEIHEQVAAEARQTLDELKGEFGDDDRWDEDLVAFYASRHQGENVSIADALRKGFQDMTQRLNAAQSDALDAKLGKQTAPAVGGGRPNTTPAPIKTISQAGDQLRERLRAAG